MVVLVELSLVVGKGQPRRVLYAQGPSREMLAVQDRVVTRYRQGRRSGAGLALPEAILAALGSAGLGCVLHCLPGDMAAKAVVLDNVIPLVRPGGVVFGTTILHGGVDQTRRSRRVIRLYNRKGIFSNLDDDLDGLPSALADRFPRHEFDVVGSVAPFAGGPSEGVARR